MPGSTPTYALPYQLLSDAPDGSALGQNLAEAVETELARIDAAANTAAPFVSVYLAADETRGNGGEGALNWTVVETVGNVTVGATAITLPAGLWEVTFLISVDGGDNGSNTAGNLRRNSTGPADGEEICLYWIANAGTKDVAGGAAKHIRCADGDELILYVRNNGSAAPVRVFSGGSRTFLTAKRVGD